MAVEWLSPTGPAAAGLDVQWTANAAAAAGAGLDVAAAAAGCAAQTRAYAGLHPLTRCRSLSCTATRLQAGTVFPEARTLCRVP